MRVFRKMLNVVSFRRTAPEQVTCGAVERNRKALREHPFVDKDPWRGYGMPTGETRASQSARPHFAGRREKKRQAQDVLQQKCLGETPARLNQTRTIAPPDKKEKLHENRGVWSQNMNGPQPNTRKK